MEPSPFGPIEDCDLGEQLGPDSFRRGTGRHEHQRAAAAPEAVPARPAGGAVRPVPGRAEDQQAGLADLVQECLAGDAPGGDARSENIYIVPRSN